MGHLTPLARRQQGNSYAEFSLLCALLALLLIGALHTFRGETQRAFATTACELGRWVGSGAGSCGEIGAHQAAASLHGDPIGGDGADHITPVDSKSVFSLSLDQAGEHGIDAVVTTAAALPRLTAAAFPATNLTSHPPGTAMGGPRSITWSNIAAGAKTGSRRGFIVGALWGGASVVFGGLLSSNPGARWRDEDTGVELTAVGSDPFVTAVVPTNEGVKRFVGHRVSLEGLEDSPWDALFVAVAYRDEDGRSHRLDRPAVVAAVEGGHVYPYFVFTDDYDPAMAPIPGLSFPEPPPPNPGLEPPAITFELEGFLDQSDQLRWLYKNEGFTPADPDLVPQIVYNEDGSTRLRYGEEVWRPGEEPGTYVHVATGAVSEVPWLDGDGEMPLVTVGSEQFDQERAMMLLPLYAGLPDDDAAAHQAFVDTLNATFNPTGVEIALEDGQLRWTAIDPAEPEHESSLSRLLAQAETLEVDIVFPVKQGQDHFGTQSLIMGNVTALKSYLESVADRKRGVFDIRVRGIAGSADTAPDDSAYVGAEIGESMRALDNAQSAAGPHSAGVDSAVLAQMLGRELELAGWRDDRGTDFEAGLQRRHQDTAQLAASLKGFTDIVTHPEVKTREVSPHATSWFAQGESVRIELGETQLDTEGPWTPVSMTMGDTQVTFSVRGEEVNVPAAVVQVQERLLGLYRASALRTLVYGGRVSPEIAFERLSPGSWDGLTAPYTAQQTADALVTSVPYDNGSAFVPLISAGGTEMVWNFGTQRFEPLGRPSDTRAVP